MNSEGRNYRMRKFFITTLLLICMICALTYAAYGEESCKIKYDLGVADIFSDNIINNNPDSFTQGESITLSAAECEGFEFGGWYLDADYRNKVTSPDTSSAEDITLYAKWFEMSYNISYVLTTPGIGISGDEIVNHNIHTRLTSEAVYLSDLYTDKSIYTFAGWYSDAEYQNRVYSVGAYTCSDITLYAKWENSEYPVFYEMGIVTQSVYTSDNPNKDSYIYSEGLTLLDATTNDPYYTFDGWYTDEFFTEKVSSIPAESHGRVVLYAKWLVKQFNITYVLVDGSGITEDVIHNYNPSSFEANSVTTLLSPITDNKSYEFAGWYTSPDFDKSNAVEIIPADTNNDITLYAKWDEAVYSITYNYGIVSQVMLPVANPNPTEYRFGDGFILENVSAEGFIFNGWCIDKNLKEKITTLPDGFYDDITIYADFTEKTYSISYVLDGEGVTASQVVNTNKTVRTTTQRVELEDAQTINKDYKFGGWYLDSNYKKKIDAISGYTTGNITLYAKWVKIIVYLPCWGDATLSEQLSAADARLILRYSAGLETGFNELQKKVSDINNDGKVTASDARLALRLVAGIETEYEIKKLYNLPTIKLIDDEIVFK